MLRSRPMKREAKTHQRPMARFQPTEVPTPPADSERWCCRGGRAATGGPVPVRRRASPSPPGLSNGCAGRRSPPPTRARARPQRPRLLVGLVGRRRPGRPFRLVDVPRQQQQQQQEEEGAVRVRAPPPRRRHGRRQRAQAPSRAPRARKRGKVGGSVRDPSSILLAGKIVALSFFITRCAVSVGMNLDST